MNEPLVDRDWVASGLRVDTGHDRIQFRAALDFIKFIDVNRYRRIVDVGSGPGHQAMVLKQLGFSVTCVDYRRPEYAELDWKQPSELSELKEYDAVWSHHCLEHIRDPIGALISWRGVLRKGGMLFLTVPQFNVTMSSGHLNSYNLPLLMYHLAVAGFQCGSNRFIKQDSHLRAAVERCEAYDPDQAVETSLTALAGYGLFSPSVSKQIEETGRFSADAIVLRWFDQTLKPRRLGIEALSYVFDSLWSRT